MNWQDEGFLLSKIKFRENANIVNVFTNDIFFIDLPLDEFIILNLSFYLNSSRNRKLLSELNNYFLISWKVFINNGVWVGKVRLVFVRELFCSNNSS